MKPVSWVAAIFLTCAALSAHDLLREAQLLGAKGAVGIQNLAVDGKRVVGTVAIPDNPGNFLLSVHTVPNFIELEPDKFLDYLKEEGLQKVIAWRTEHKESARPGREGYTKFAKHC